jgi:hypothetical protein
MTVHIEDERTREAVVRYIEQLKARAPETGLHLSDEKLREIHASVIEDLEGDVLSYDRRQRVDCQYEPIAGWCFVRFDAAGRVASLHPAGDNGEAPGPNESLAQFCLVWPNTHEEGTTPYAGTWDGHVEDYHRDGPYEWEVLRDCNAFGFAGDGSHEYGDYRFLKTSLRVMLPDCDGRECLPEYFHVAAKDAEPIKEFVRAWNKEEYGELNADVMEDVPVRLVIANPMRPNLKPFTGAWDGAPWEDA